LKEAVKMKRQKKSIDAFLAGEIVKDIMYKGSRKFLIKWKNIKGTLGYLKPLSHTQ